MLCNCPKLQQTLTIKDIKKDSTKNKLAKFKEEYTSNI
jgi:hypothetical protein